DGERPGSGPVASPRRPIPDPSRSNVSSRRGPDPDAGSVASVLVVRPRDDRRVHLRRGTLGLKLLSWFLHLLSDPVGRPSTTEVASPRGAARTTGPAPRIAPAGPAGSRRLRS